MVNEGYMLRHRKTIEEGINDYLANEKIFDYEILMKSKNQVLKDVRQAAFYAYKYMGKDTYVKFMKKALPFEPYFDGSNAQEKEEYKEKMTKLAMAIKERKGNLIDILDAGITNLYHYMLMVKQLAFKYKTIPASAYVVNAEYLKSVANYNNPNESSTVTFSKNSVEDEKRIDEILNTRGLRANGITRTAAQHYCKRNNGNNNKR